MMKRMTIYSVRRYVDDGDAAADGDDDHDDDQCSGSGEEDFAG